MLRVLPIVLVCVSCVPLAAHNSVPHRAQQPRFSTWEAVFAHPTALAVRAFKTGEVLTGPAVLIDADDPRTPASAKREQWVPSVTYLVEHPTEGKMLMDAGVEGDCSYGLKPVFWIPCRAFEGHTAVPALRSRGLDVADLRYVLMSHFHGDHAAGIPALDRAAQLRILTSETEWDDVTGFAHLRLGYFNQHLVGRYMVERLLAQNLVEMPLVGPAWDLFGDASIWVFPTAGHTRGQLSVLLNAASGPVLLTFDASHLEAGFTLGIPPGYTVDREAAVSSLSRLRALEAAFPAMRVVYGHEPTQWPEGVFEQELARAEQ